MAQFGEFCLQLHTDEFRYLQFRQHSLTHGQNIWFCHFQMQIKDKFKYFTTVSTSLQENYLQRLSQQMNYFSYHPVTSQPQNYTHWSRWPHGLRRGFADVRWLGLRIQILLGAWICVWWVCCVLSGRGFYNGPIPRPEDSYRVCVCVCVTECYQVQQ